MTDSDPTPDPEPGAETDGENLSDELAGADYDAQSDLALGTPTHPDPTEDGFVPYAGMLTPEHDEPGYDLDRDTAS